MFYIRPLEENEESYKLLYAFTKENNPMWKHNFLESFKLLKLNPIKQGNMSEFEYFKTLHKIQKQAEIIPSKEYFLIANGIAVVSIQVMMRNQNIADISFGTDHKYRKKGYATIALKMIEQMLFRNPTILFTTIMDYTPNKITSKIALKSGYEFNEDTNYFIKANPNINLEDLMENKR